MKGITSIELTDETALTDKKYSRQNGVRNLVIDEVSNYLGSQISTGDFVDDFYCSLDENSNGYFGYSRMKLEGINRVIDNVVCKIDFNPCLGRRYVLKVKVNDDRLKYEIGDKIHNQLAENKFYIDNGIVLNIRIPETILLFVYEEVDEMPVIEF